MFFQNSNFKDYQIKDDIRRLINFYRNNGFKNIKVTQQTEFIASNNRFNIYFYIDEGYQYQFNDIDIDLQKLNLSESDNNNIQLLKDSFVLNKLKKKKIFNPEFINLLKIKITDFLYEKGIVFFDIIEFEKVSTFPDTNKLDDAQFKLGLCYMNINQIDRARQEFVNLLESYPNSEYYTRAQDYLNRIK